MSSQHNVLYPTTTLCRDYQSINTPTCSCIQLKHTQHGKSLQIILYLNSVVFLNTKLVDVIIFIKDSKPKSSWLVCVLFCHDLNVHHFAVLLNHIQNVLFRCVGRQATEEYFLCSLMSLWILVFTGDSPLCFNLQVRAR